MKTSQIPLKSYFHILNQKPGALQLNSFIIRPYIHFKSLNILSPYGNKYNYFEGHLDQWRIEVPLKPPQAPGHSILADWSFLLFAFNSSLSPREKMMKAATQSRRGGVI